MASFKIQKKSWLRRRFIKSEALHAIEGWSDVSEKLKEKILTDSTYQLVGNKVVLAINAETQETHILVEVLGIPKEGFQILDFEPRECLLYEHPETIFDVDFLTLKDRGRDLIKGIPHHLEDSYHIVFEGEKIALHFFIQKDYIDS